MTIQAARKSVLPISSQARAHTLGDVIADVLAQARRVREEIYETGHMPDNTGQLRPVWPVGLTKGRGEALREMARACGATRILETGLALGMSSSFLLDAALSTLQEAGPAGCADTWSVPVDLLTSIDPGETLHSADAGLIHLRNAGLDVFHRFIPDRSELALPELIRRGETFDLAFIDGDHHFDGAMIDMFYALRLVKAGGLIVLDDAWMPAVQKASAFFVSNGLCERARVFSEGGKERLHALRPMVDRREWDHFVDF